MAGPQTIIVGDSVEERRDVLLRNINKYSEFL